MCRERQGRVLCKQYRGTAARWLRLVCVLAAMGVCEQTILASGMQEATHWCTLHAPLLATADLVAAARLCLRPMPQQGTESLGEADAAGNCQACQCQLMASVLPAAVAYFNTNASALGNSKVAAAATSTIKPSNTNPMAGLEATPTFSAGTRTYPDGNITHVDFATESRWLLTTCLPVVAQLWSMLPLSGIDLQARLQELAACQWTPSTSKWPSGCTTQVLQTSSSSSSGSSAAGMSAGTKPRVAPAAAAAGSMTAELDVVRWRALCSCDAVPGQATLCDPDTWHTYQSTCHAQCMGLQDVSKLRPCTSLFQPGGTAAGQAQRANTPATSNDAAPVSVTTNDTATTSAVVNGGMLTAQEEVGASSNDTSTKQENKASTEAPARQHTNMQQSSGGRLGAAAAASGPAAAADSKADRAAAAAVLISNDTLDTANGTLDQASEDFYYYDDAEPQGGFGASMGSSISGLQLSQAVTHQSHNATTNQPPHEGVVMSEQHNNGAVRAPSSAGQPPGAPMITREAEQHKATTRAPSSVDWVSGALMKADAGDAADGIHAASHDVARSSCPISATDAYLMLGGPALPSYLTSCDAAACMLARIAAAMRAAVQTHSNASMPASSVNPSLVSHKSELVIEQPTLWTILQHLGSNAGNNVSSHDDIQHTAASLLHSRVDNATAADDQAAAITACLPQLAAAVVMATAASGRPYIAALQTCDFSRTSLPSTCLAGGLHGSFPTEGGIADGGSVVRVVQGFKGAKQAAAERGTVQAVGNSSVRLPDLQLPATPSPPAAADTTAVPAAQLMAALPLMPSTPQLAQLLEKVSVLMSPNTAGMHTSNNSSSRSGSNNSSFKGSNMNAVARATGHEGALQATRSGPLSWGPLAQELHVSTLKLSQLQSSSQQPGVFEATDKSNSPHDTVFSNSSSVNSDIPPASGVMANVTNSIGPAASNTQAPETAVGVPALETAAAAAAAMMQANTPSLLPVWSFTSPSGNFHISVTSQPDAPDVQTQVQQQPSGLLATLLQGRGVSQTQRGAAGSEVGDDADRGDEGGGGGGEETGAGGGWPVIRWPALCSCGRDYAPVCSKVTMAWYPSSCYAKCQGVAASELMACADLASLTAASTTATDSNSSPDNDEAASGTALQLHPGAHDTQQDEADSNDSLYYYY